MVMWISEEMRRKLYAIPAARGAAALIVTKDGEEHAAVGTHEYIEEIGREHGYMVCKVPAVPTNGKRIWELCIYLR